MATPKITPTSVYENQLSMKTHRPPMIENTAREDSTLPSNRMKYIHEHPANFNAKLHSSENLIAPFWPKVSQTAWEGRAKLCGGYGIKMHVSIL